MEIYRIHRIDKQLQANQPINAMDYTELIIRELWPGIEPEKLQRYYGLGCESPLDRRDGKEYDLQHDLRNLRA